MTIEQPGCRGRTYPRDTWIAVRRVTDQGEEVGNQDGLHPELRAHAFLVEDAVPSAVNLDDPLAANALRQVLVRCPDADRSHRLTVGGNLRCRREPVVSLELDHGPHRYAHCHQRLFEGCCSCSATWRKST